MSRAGAAVSFPYFSQDFERVVLMAGTGDDRLVVSSSRDLIQVTVRGGAGADVIQVGNATLDAIRSEVAVDGETGIDRLVVNDRGTGIGNVYTVTTSEVTRGAAAEVEVSISTFEEVSLFTGLLGDQITVRSAAVPVSVNGGAGNDVINAGGGTLDDLQGPLTLDGGADRTP